MDFFHGRGRCSEDEEVEMIRDMDKVPYASSSSQYKSSSTTTQPLWFSYDHQSESSNLHHKNEVIVINNNDDKRGESEGGGGSGSRAGGDDVECIEREHMFDKVVTPSDVGKLNRLVIPKQHAEKYFPLDSTANEKGLLLNFEDRSGKPWRFRYSYWNSSQSYVMTKGWSRFVKEKKLYAGDIVSFERGAGDSVKDRLYIDWRRRSDVQDPGPLPLLHHHHHPLMPRTAPWGGLILPPTMSMPMPRDDMIWQRMNYGHAHLQRTNYNGYGGVGSGYNVMNSSSTPPLFYLRSSASQQIGVGVGLVQQGGEGAPVVFNSVPVVHGKASAKRLRLFGVNLDCPIPENPEYQFLDSTASIAHPTMSSYTPQTQTQNPPSNPQLQLRLYNNDSPPESPKDNPSPSSMSLDLDM